MKTKLPLTVLISLLSISAFAQWTSRAPFPGIARAKSTTFTINEKMYVLGGVTSSSMVLGDFWEYDIASNTWMQKPDFPGAERYSAVSFVLGNTGYVATGGNDNGFLDDMWQYDPVTSQWLQKTGLPATQAQRENQRIEAFAFVINNRVYLGGGSGFVFGPNATTNIAFNDLWEFNPSTNTWTIKSGFPDFIGRNMSIASVINGKGYIGLGCNVDQTINHKSFWEYDAVNDSWTSKADFPANFTADAGCFTLNSALYVIGGVNLNPVSLSNQVYKYDVSTNTWSPLPAFNGGAIAGQISIASGSRAFVGGGYTSNIIPRNDFWEFTPVTTDINETVLNEKDGILIYPNPASKTISITSAKEIFSVEAYDLSGKMVLSITNDFISIDINTIPPGVYQLRYIFIDGKTGSNRFLKY